MKCSIAQRNIPAYLDNAVSEEERRAVGSHLRACQACSEACVRHARLLNAFRSLPKPQVPPDLTVRLRMIASRERARRIGRFRMWWDHFSFGIRGLVRPVALPLAGGLFAAVTLFSMIAPTFSQPVVSGDVPCLLFTQPVLENIGPIGFAAGDAVVDLRLDQQGRIVNYSIVSSSGKTDEIHRSIENSLLFTRFTPGKVAPNSCPNCTVPMPGTLRMVFRSSHIEVRG